MQLLQILVPNDQLVTITDTLDEMGATAVQTEETSARNGTVLYVPVPDGGAQPVLDRLHEAGLEETYTVRLDGNAATDVDLGLDELDDRYVPGPKGDAGLDNTSLRERAEDLTPGRWTYIAFAAFSAIIAVAGLLLNSATVIVGAMVISPFAGSSLSAAVGAVISDREMAVDSVSSQLLGLGVALAAAGGASFLLRWSSFVPPALVVSRLDQVAAFITPSLLALTIAIAAGAVGALALATELPTAITGIAVAAAIVPAAAATGVGLVWNAPFVAAGAVVLLVMNVVTINLAAYIGLVALGYRSSIIETAREGLAFDLRTGGYAVAIVIFVVALSVASFGTYQYLTFEHAVNGEAQTTLTSAPYEELELMSVSTSYSGGVIDGESPSVTITVGRSSASDYPSLPTVLQNRIEAATDRSVTVQIRFVDYEQA